MQKTNDAGTACGSWAISTQTKNGVVTGFAVMSEEPKRAAPGTGRQIGGVAGARQDNAAAQAKKAG